MREDYIMRKMEFIDDIQKCIPQIDAENGKYRAGDGRKERTARRNYQ